MKTPIVDFCREYADSAPVRLHMPGHKGTGPLGPEALDLTEIDGADSLFEAAGIIAESEANAASLFGTRRTFYSACGSSASIKALCLLACRHVKTERPVIAAGRNAHKSFVQAAQLLDFDIAWIPSEDPDVALCRCTITPAGLKAFLQSQDCPVAAVYVTSPDYLGNVLDIAGLARVAHDAGSLLLVDNAHGAYLRFLPEDRHPITLGADACADSAHKTLPVLTGGGYLHISRSAPEHFEDTAKEALCLFGSTSPSYLILQSLDAANAWLATDAGQQFAETAARVRDLRQTAEETGLRFVGDEPLKLTLDCTASGVGSGKAVADILRGSGIEVEFADPDYVVMMWSPSNTADDFTRTEIALFGLPEAPNERDPLPAFHLPQQVYTPKEALLLPSKEVPVEKAIGCIAANTDFGCPPAICPIVAGERIDSVVQQILQYYGHERIRVLK